MLDSFSLGDWLTLVMWIVSWQASNLLSKRAGKELIAWKLFTFTNILMIVFGYIEGYLFMSLQGSTFLITSLRGWVNYSVNPNRLIQCFIRVDKIVCKFIHRLIRGLKKPLMHLRRGENSSNV